MLLQIQNQLFWNLKHKKYKDVYIKHMNNKETGFI